MNSIDTVTVTARRYVTLQQAALYCGLSEKTLRRMFADRQLVPHRVRGRVLVDLHALDAAIQDSAGGSGATA
jgi:excisionase family DNA binding protein